MIGYDTVSEEPDAVVRALAPGHLIVDAATDRHLRDIGEAAADLPLVSGGSGVAAGLPDAYRRRNLLGSVAADALPAVGGPAAILSGSCSRATREQVARRAERGPALRLDPMALAEEPEGAAAAADWVADRMGGPVPMVYATAT